MISPAMRHICIHCFDVLFFAIRSGGPMEALCWLFKGNQHFRNWMICCHDRKLVVTSRTVKTWEIKNNSTRIAVNKTSRICSLKFNLSHSRINLTRWTRLPPHSALISLTLFWRCLLNSFPFKQHHIDWLQKSYERWIVVKIIPASTEKPSDLGNLLEQFQMHLFPRPEHQLSGTKNPFGGKHSLHADVSYFLRSLRRHLKKELSSWEGDCKPFPVFNSSDGIDIGNCYDLTYFSNEPCVSKNG